MRPAVIVGLAGVTVMLTASSVTSQTVRHQLTGRVLDEATRTPIRAAVVQIAKTNRRVLTDSLGRFAFSDVPAGTYALAASALGYRETIAPAGTGRPVLILVAPEPVPLVALVAMTRARNARLRGATVKVFGREDLLAAGEMPVAQFVNWKAHFITRPCHVADTLGGPMEWVGMDCILGPRGSFSPVRVMLDGEPLTYSSELWSHQTWDLGRVDVVYQYTAVDYPFLRPTAFIRMYTLPYLSRTAARVSGFCNRVSNADTIADGYLASLCRP